MPNKIEGVPAQPQEIKFLNTKRMHAETEGYNVQDQRCDQPTAKVAHEWARANKLYIRCDFWGSGNVEDQKGRMVDPESLPDFVKKHIEFRSPNDDEGEKPKEYRGTKVGDIVHADILQGEIVGGEAAGLDPRIKLEGIGQTDLREVYNESELTENAKPGDTTWAARVIEVPDENE